VSATLPNALTRVLLTDAVQRGGLPLAIQAGLAAQTEPPARRFALWAFAGGAGTPAIARSASRAGSVTGRR